MAEKREELPDDSYEALLISIKSGNTESESKLVRLFLKGLRFILLRKCNDINLVEDLIQETFIIVLDKARKGLIQEPKALAKFVRQVGVNLLIAHFRKEKRHSTDTSSDIAIQYEDQSPGLYKCLAASQMLDIVCQVMNEMKVDRDKELLTQYFIYEKEKTEVCSQLALSPEHFDRVLYRAKNRLKQLLNYKISLEGSSETKTLVSLFILVFLIIAYSNLQKSNVIYSDFFVKQVGELKIAQHLLIQPLSFIASYTESGMLLQRKRLL